MFPEEDYHDIVFNKMPMKALKPAHKLTQLLENGTKQFATHCIQLYSYTHLRAGLQCTGAFDALSKGFLLKMSLSVFSEEPSAKDMYSSEFGFSENTTMLEDYTFTVNCTGCAIARVSASVHRPYD